MCRESSTVISVNFVKKFFYSNGDNEFFLSDCLLLAHPVEFFVRLKLVDKISSHVTPLAVPVQ